MESFYFCRNINQKKKTGMTHWHFIRLRQFSARRFFVGLLSVIGQFLTRFVFCAAANQEAAEIASSPGNLLKFS